MQTLANDCHHAIPDRQLHHSNPYGIAHPTTWLTILAYRDMMEHSKQKRGTKNFYREDFENEAEKSG